MSSRSIQVEIEIIFFSPLSIMINVNEYHNIMNEWMNTTTVTVVLWEAHGSHGHEALHGVGGSGAGGAGGATGAGKERAHHGARTSAHAAAGAAGVAAGATCGNFHTIFNSTLFYLLLKERIMFSHYYNLLMSHKNSVSLCLFIWEHSDWSS